MTLYEESMEFLQEVIRRVKVQFGKKKNHEEFNYTKHMYTALHQDDLDENAQKKRKLTKDEEYELALMYQRQYTQKLQDIIQKYKIRPMNEDQLPAQRKNVIKCEEKPNAFIDMKKRKFFQTMDVFKHNSEQRLEKIIEAIDSLNRCHMQVERYYQIYGLQDQTLKEVNENIVVKPIINKEGEVTGNQRRTILHGVPNIHFRDSNQFFSNEKIQNFINTNSTEARREKKRLDFIKFKKNLIKKKEEQKVQK